MSAHVLLNLLNELGERNKCEAFLAETLRFCHMRDLKKVIS